MSSEKNIGITVKKDTDISEWYTQVIQKAELAEYTDVSGCMVIRPRAYAIWETIQEEFNKQIKALGVRNAYFPSLIPEHLLVKEKEHVAGFSPEVAWVTMGGSTPLSERLAIRPTSETIMYDSFKRWIRSYNDLPLKINQWCNIIRWEFKHPVPFLRGREFLWQEGHTVFATQKEAEEEVFLILDIYADIMEKFFAVPVLKGKKTDNEKFAGALFTASIETVLPNGKAIQIATSHQLGQNFAKAFEISFIDKDTVEKIPWQNSWGFSTRTIGIMTLVHGDDKGLVIPPRIAPVHAVIVPIKLDSDNDLYINKILGNLKKFSVFLDDRKNHTPGFKFNDWELKGVPLRIEVGPRDIEERKVVLVRRDTGVKESVPIDDIASHVERILNLIQESLLSSARERMKSSIVHVDDFDALKKCIEDKRAVSCYFCNEREAEEAICSELSIKSLNIPLIQPDLKGKKCIFTGKDAKVFMYFGKSY